MTTKPIALEREDKFVIGAPPFYKNAHQLVVGGLRAFLAVRESVFLIPKKPIGRHDDFFHDTFLRPAARRMIADDVASRVEGGRHMRHYPVMIAVVGAIHDIGERSPCLL